MRGLLNGGLVVFGLALASAVSCGGDSDATPEPTPEPAVVVRGVVSRPEDISLELEAVIHERFVKFDEFDLSGGLINGTLRSVNDADAINARPRSIFERLIENYVGKPFREKGGFPVVYSSAILFEHPDGAERFFDEARRRALTLDWFETHPALSNGEAVDRPLVREVSIPECEAGHGQGQNIEEAFWLHASGSVHDGTIHDDILFLRDGALWAMVRVPDHFPGLVSEDTDDNFSPCPFQHLIGEDVIRRMVEARGTY